MGSIAVIVDVGEGHALEVLRLETGDYTAAVCDGGAELVLRGSPPQLLATVLGLAERIAQAELEREVSLLALKRTSTSVAELMAPDLVPGPAGGYFVKWSNGSAIGLTPTESWQLALSTDDGMLSASVRAHPLVMRLALLALLGAHVREVPPAAPPERPLSEVYDTAVQVLKLKGASHG